MCAGNVQAVGIEEKVTVIPGRAATPKDEALISSTALKVMRHIAQAREYIHQKDQASARKEIYDAQTLLEIIKATVPSEKVKDHIWVADKHLTYESTETVMQDLVPIYASLDEIKDFAVKDKVREHVDNAKKHMEKNDRKGAKEDLKLADDNLIFTEIDLPIHETEKQIVASLGHLANKELKKADATLKAAEDGVVFVSVSEPTPALQAKKSFWQATRNYADGKMDATKAEIKKVKGYLVNAGKIVDAKTKVELDKISTDIDTIEGKLDKFDQQTGRQELRKLYNRLKALI